MPTSNAYNLNDELENEADLDQHVLPVISVQACRRPGVWWTFAQGKGLAAVLSTWQATAPACKGPVSEMSGQTSALTCNLQHVEEAAYKEGHKEDACTDPVHLQTYQ